MRDRRGSSSKLPRGRRSGPKGAAGAKDTSSPLSYAPRTVGTARCRRRLAAVETSPDAVLQIGAYYNFTGHRGLRPRLRTSYHDSNLALFRRHWTYIEDPEASHIRATMRAERRLLDRLDVVFAMSEWLRTSFVEDFQQDPAKIVVVGAGVNRQGIADTADREWDRLRVLFVGFEWERKGGPVQLEAFRRVRSELREAELHIVGASRPPDAPDVPGVEWVGRIDRSTTDGDLRIDSLYRNATAYATVPVYDPFPNAVLEAMAYGLPVIGVARGSMPEMVVDGETGLLVGDDDPDEIAAALLAMVSDPTAAVAMGDAGRRRVLEKFTWDRVAERMLSTISSRLT